MVTQPAKAADATSAAMTPRTALLIIRSFDRRPVEARTKVLTIVTASPGRDFSPLALSLSIAEQGLCGAVARALGGARGSGAPRRRWALRSGRQSAHDRDRLL